MKLIKPSIFIVAILMLASSVAAQKQKAQPKRKPVTIEKKDEPTDPAQEEKKVKDMIAFLELMLNTLGSSTTSAREKDVLVTESYSKIFRDNKVQIEDDLEANRSVITNKDVTAYLKDVNFFFREVRFELTVDKIESGVGGENQVFYKVSLHRNLSGTTIDGKVIENTTPRFIEVNFNPKKQDLKIVSIYTNEFDERVSLLSWWKELSLGWRSVFMAKLHLADSVSFGEIKKVISIEELDLGGNKSVQSFEPLSQLKNLKVLNLSGTNITDLSPIRNLGELTELNLSHTSIQDIGALKYSGNLTSINLAYTDVKDISVIQRMLKLQRLDLSFSAITNFTPITRLFELRFLNLRASKIFELSPIKSLTGLDSLIISRTTVSSLSSIETLKNLEVFACDSTQVQNFNPLASLDKLKVVYANATFLSDLQPLQKLDRLEKIYCNRTLIKKNTAEAFMLAHSHVSVVYDSRDLKLWWDGLSDLWREIIVKAAKISHDPSSEELTRIGNLDSINLASNNQVKSLEPLRKFQRLKVVIAGRTPIQDLSPLKENKEIRYLDISNTQVSDLSPLDALTKLEVIKADGCKIASLESLKKLQSLQRLYFDATTINDINATEFLQINPKSLLVYKSAHLRRWWKNLSENWRTVFLAQVNDTTTESLHRLVEQESFHFKDIPVIDLNGFTEFIRLRDLNFSGTAITEIILPENLKSLKSLQASDSPIQSLEFVNSLNELEDFNVSNTPIEDLTPVWNLRKLKSLICAGTQIKRLDAVEKLESLETLDCSNTNVGKITALDYLHLKLFKCYNTRISNKSIENFIASHPGCKVVYYR